MSTIKLTISENISDYKTITFRAPGNSENCTALVIGTTPYEFLDSAGNSVLGKSGFFASGAILSTTVDVTNHKLYLHNTSNVYLSDDTCSNIAVPEGSTLDYALCNMKVGGGAELVEVSSELSGIVQGTLPSSASWYSVCYGNDKFVAIAYNSNIFAYSTDGITWTQGTLPTSASWYSVCYGNDKFVTVASNSNKFAYSTDGITWTEGTMPTSASWYSVCYGNGKFVTVAYSSSTMAYSYDGINWTKGTLPSSDYWKSVCYGNGKFVAISSGVSPTFAYSTNGIKWIAGTTPSISDVSNTSWLSVCYGNGKFVAIAGGANISINYFAYSTDGINWTAGTIPGHNWTSVCYGNGMFVAVANYGVFAYSTDGINWTEGTMPTSAIWRSVCYSNGMFVAITYSSNISAIIPFEFSLEVSRLTTGKQLLFEAPTSLANIDINDTQYNIINSSDNSVTIPEGTLALVTLDPDNQKAYI